MIKRKAVELEDIAFNLGGGDWMHGDAIAVLDTDGEQPELEITLNTSSETSTSTCVTFLTERPSAIVISICVGEIIEVLRLLGIDFDAANTGRGTCPLAANEYVGVQNG